MWLTLLTAQGADVWTTQRALRRGGRELNPVIRAVMRATGDLWGLVKIAVVLLVMWNLYTPDIAWVIWLVSGATFLLALNNYRVAR